MGKNILICTESLGTGGVETVVYNQSVALKEKGNNVVVLAKNGAYTEKLKENNIKCIEMEFELENNVNLKKAHDIIEIIKKYNIQEVQLHKFICIPAVLPACMISKTPYIIYVHEGLSASYDWFINTFDIYENLLKVYFDNAYKIICITENVKKYNMNRFDIPEEKYKVIHNSIDFNLYKCKEYKEFDGGKSFLTISRFANEKIQLIKNSIDLYILYCKKNPNYKCILKVAGDGIGRKEIEKYIKEKNKDNFDIELLGETSDIAELISESDIVMGIGRCVLESIAMKKVVLISGYENLKGILTPKNIEKSLEENFSGRNMENRSTEECIKEIEELNQKSYKELVESNYKFVYENLNIKNNIYTIPQDEKIEQYKVESLYNELRKTKENLVTKIIELEKTKTEKKEMELYLKEEAKRLESISIEKEDKINNLNNELDKIYNSRTWKYSRKFVNLIKRKK